MSLVQQLQRTEHLSCLLYDDFSDFMHAYKLFGIALR